MFIQYIERIYNMFEFGFYEKEITPPLGCAMPGYFNLRASTDVKDRLYARAVAVRSDSNCAIIISIDQCVMQSASVKAVTDRVEEYTGIERGSILVSCTHTHTGIPLKDDGWQDDEKSYDAKSGYDTVATKLIADCAILAYMRMQRAEVFFGKGEVDGISFCRNFYMKNSSPRTNPPRTSPEIEGPVSDTDNELPLLFVKDLSGNPLGVIISFACHPDCVDREMYSGDYISELSIQLKKNFGNDFVTVFLLGTCGNINHFDVSKKSDAADHYKMMGQKIAGEAIKTVAFASPLKQSGVKTSYEKMIIDRVEITEDEINEAKHTIETIKEMPGVKIAADGSDPDQYKLGMAKRLMAFLDTAAPKYEVPMQVMQIGEFTLYAFPSEIFCHFGTLVKAGDGTGVCMVASLCNAWFGYVPTRDMFYDTIYESCPGTNLLNKEAGYIMAEKLVSMKK